MNGDLLREREMFLGGERITVIELVGDEIDEAHEPDIVTKPTARGPRVRPERQRQSVAEHEYLSLRELADYSGRSVRWIQYQMKDTAHPLPYYQHTEGGKLSFRRSEYDRWQIERRKIGNPKIDDIVASVMSSLGKAK